MVTNNDICTFEACFKMCKYIKDEHSIAAVNYGVFEKLSIKLDIIIVNNT